MANIIFISAAFALLAFSAPRGAAAFDFVSSPEPLKFAEVKTPAVPAPAPAAPKVCKPFLLSVSVGGVDETVALERACTPGNEAVWGITVETRGPGRASVKVRSDKYPAERDRLEARIRSMVIDGIGQQDADFIVMRTGPALKAAAAAAPAEKERLLAEAAEALKVFLARP